MREVRINRWGEFAVSGGGTFVWYSQIDAYILSDSVAGETSAASLARAVRLARKEDGLSTERLWLSPQRREELESTSYPRTHDAWIEWNEDNDVFGVAELEVNEPLDEPAARQLLQGLKRPRVELHRILLRDNDNFIAETWPPGDAILKVMFAPRRGASLGDIHVAAADALVLLRAVRDQSVGIALARALLLAGRPDLLVGQHESNDLDAKRTPYRIDDPVEQFELAKDVAAFANDQGGLIAIGLATRSADEGDTISKVHPFELSSVSVRRYSRLIARRVFPPPEGLSFNRVSFGGPEMGILVIDVPEQADALKPFLVHGAVIGGRVVGTHVSFFERRGSDTRAASPAELHALMNAGRVALYEATRRQAASEAGVQGESRSRSR
jgi:hypothetical protein